MRGRTRIVPLRGSGSLPPGLPELSALPSGRAQPRGLGRPPPLSVPVHREALRTAPAPPSFPPFLRTALRGARGRRGPPRGEPRVWWGATPERHVRRRPGAALPEPTSARRGGAGRGRSDTPRPFRRGAAGSGGARCGAGSALALRRAVPVQRCPPCSSRPPPAPPPPSPPLPSPHSPLPPPAGAGSGAPARCGCAVRAVRALPPAPRLHPLVGAERPLPGGEQPPPPPPPLIRVPPSSLPPPAAGRAGRGAPSSLPPSLPPRRPFPLSGLGRLRTAPPPSRAGRARGTPGAAVRGAARRAAGRGGRTTAPVIPRGGGGSLSPSHSGCRCQCLRRRRTAARRAAVRPAASSGQGPASPRRSPRSVARLVEGNRCAPGPPTAAPPPSPAPPPRAGRPAPLARVTPGPFAPHPPPGAGGRRRADGPARPSDGGLHGNRSRDGGRGGVPRGCWGGGAVGSVPLRDGGGRGRRAVTAVVPLRSVCPATAPRAAARPRAEDPAPTHRTPAAPAAVGGSRGQTGRGAALAVRCGAAVAVGRRSLRAEFGGVAAEESPGGGAAPLGGGRALLGDGAPRPGLPLPRGAASGNNC